MLKIFLLTVQLLLTLQLVNSDSFPGENPLDCTGVLSAELVEEIQGYQERVNQIIDAAINGQFKGHIWKELAHFTDRFGPRWTGHPSNSLEESIDYIMEKMTNNGLDNVKDEEVIGPYNWTRGYEHVELFSPINKTLHVLAQLGSVATPEEGITGPVIVFTDMEEMEANKTKVDGKIVLFDYHYTVYDSALPYRRWAASFAGALGAKAILVRSTTPYSLDTPHTTGVVYEKDMPEIPSVAVTVEDAAMMRRMQERGDEIQIKIILHETEELNVTTRNSMGDYLGTEKPEEIVIISGHIDSVDVGMGAIDDGAGVILATESLLLLKTLNLTTRRTVRAVLFTAEEMGLYGAFQYVDAHADEIEQTVVALEADMGAFYPYGLHLGGDSKEAACILKEILELTKPRLINTTYLGWFNQSVGVSTDLYALQAAGIPGVGLYTEAPVDYFYYHHTAADTMTPLKTNELDMNLGLWASTAYVLADLSVALPREDSAPATEPPEENSANGKILSTAFLWVLGLWYLVIC